MMIVSEDGDDQMTMVIVILHLILVYIISIRKDKDCFGYSSRQTSTFFVSLDLCHLLLSWKVTVIF